MVSDYMKPCGHARPQDASQLHGVCIFCYRDRLGAMAVRQRALESALREIRDREDTTVHGAHVDSVLLSIIDKALLGDAAEFDSARAEKQLDAIDERNARMDSDAAEEGGK